MKDGEGERSVFQDKMNTLELELDNATCENLKLKGLTFDLDYQRSYYLLQHDTLSKKLKMLNDKQSKLTRELEQVHTD